MRKLPLTGLLFAALLAACENKTPVGPGRVVSTQAASTTTSTTTSTIAPPTTAAFVFSPAAPKVAQVVIFNAVSTIVTPGRTISNYGWDFGDGGAAAGATTSHAYALEGIYNVALTVTDDAGTKTTVILPVPVSGMLSTTTTTTVPRSASVRYVNNSTLATLPNDMSLFFDQTGAAASVPSLRGRLMRLLPNAEASFTVRGIFSTINNAVIGSIAEGSTFMGTITPSVAGQFTGALKVDSPPCTRKYSGSVDQLLQWTGELPAPACAGPGTALAFDSFTLLKSSTPPGSITMRR